MAAHTGVLAPAAHDPLPPTTLSLPHARLTGFGLQARRVLHPAVGVGDRVGAEHVGVGAAAGWGVGAGRHVDRADGGAWRMEKGGGGGQFKGGGGGVTEPLSSALPLPISPSLAGAAAAAASMAASTRMCAIMAAPEAEKRTGRSWEREVVVVVSACAADGRPGATSSVTALVAAMSTIDARPASGRRGT